MFNLQSEWLISMEYPTANDEFVKAIVNTVTQPMFIIDSRKNSLIANDAFRDFIGTDEESTCKSEALILFYQDLLQINTKLFRKDLKSESQEIFTDFQGKSHSIFIQRCIWRDDMGSKLLIATLRKNSKIKDYKKAETQFIASLKDSEKRFRSTFDQIAFGIVYVTPSGQFFLANQKFSEIVGYSIEELLSMKFQEITYPEDLPTELAYFDQMLAGKIDTYSLDKRYIRKDGQLVWSHLTVSLFCEELESSNQPKINLSQPKYFICTVEDIAHHKKTETALRQAHQKLTFHIENSPLAVIEWDNQSRVLRWSSQAETIFGWKAEEVLGKSWHEWEFVAETDVDAVFDNAASMRSGRELRTVNYNRNYTKDGRVLDCEWYNSVLLDESGNVESVLSLALDVTERKKSEKELRNSKLLIEQITNSLPLIVYIYDLTTGSNVYANRQIYEVLGYTTQEIQQRGNEWVLATIHPEDLPTFLEAASRLANISDTEVIECEFRQKRADGSWCWFRCRNVVFNRNAEGVPEQILGTALDITTHKQAEQALKKSEEQFRLLFELAPIGIAIVGLDAQFLRVNQSFCDLLDYTAEELMSRTKVDIIHPDDLISFNAGKKKLLAGEVSHFQLERRYIAKNGKIVYTIANVVLVRDSQGEPLHFISQVVDISDRKRVEEQLLHDALHDGLTGLPNRGFLNQRLDYAIQRAKRYPDYLFAILFIDLDRFKVVNDSLGHGVGDELLVAIAHQLQKIVRSTDTVARLGGDEFVMLLEDIKDIKDATRIAERIEEVLRSPFLVEGREVFTTASSGIALSSTGYEQGSEILRDADIAMYRAKDLGRARYEVFDKAMHVRALRIMQLETDLRRAIERQEFLLYYQPIVCLQTGCLTGFEALIRWQHPQEGLVSPAEFIPLAEETGLIVPMGKWILHEACHQMQAWQSHYPHTKDWKMSVNLSTKQLREADFIKQIDEVLQETKLKASSLKLEITESVLMENAETATTILSELRARNIQLSLDDFGTGYSSLSYLHRFPVNTLKIDRSFVNQMNMADEKLEIVRAIVTLAHSLNMDVIAEGVETEAQLNQLKERGCEQGQGYYFSKPLNPEATEALISRLTE